MGIGVILASIGLGLGFVSYFYILYYILKIGSKIENSHK